MTVLNIMVYIAAGLWLAGSATLLILAVLGTRSNYPRRIK